MGPNRVNVMGTASLVLLSALTVLATIASGLCPQPARGQGEPPPPHTGPIDPAAGAWIAYRVERTEPDRTGPELFSLRVEYGFLPGEPLTEMSVLAGTVETDGQGRVTASRSFVIDTVDRSYTDRDSGEEGYWPYWLAPGLREGEMATVGDMAHLAAEEVQDYTFKGHKLRAVKLAGGGMEVLAEQRTGLVLQLKRDGGYALTIEDTNMLAQYPAWGYAPDASSLGESLSALEDEYPDLVEVSSLGKSSKGRDVWIARVTDFASEEDKLSMLLVAGMEGDAPEGSALLLDFLEEFLARARSEEGLARTLEGLNLYILPLLNPDGMQRWLAMPDPRESVTLENQASRNARLVNIDRNFDTRWREADRDPASADYGGSSAFSEPESSLLRDLMEDIGFDIYVNIHTGKDLVTAPWNWSENPSDNPESSFYREVLADITRDLPLQSVMGPDRPPFGGSSTDWAYGGGGASSPACFELHLRRPSLEGGASGEGGDYSMTLEERGSISLYRPQVKALYRLVENLRSYVGVEISSPELGAEINVPVDVRVQVRVTGIRPLPDARVRLVLPDQSAFKFSGGSQKEVALGDLSPGADMEAAWSLEGKAKANEELKVVLESSYPEYERIPGTFTSSVSIRVSTQRTWIVILLLSVSIVILLAFIASSIRKQRRAEKR